MRLPMFKHSGGLESVSFTMLVTGFSVVTLWLLLSVFESLFGLQTREFSGSEAMAYLTPLCLLYFGRRWKEVVDGAKTDDGEFEITVDESEVKPAKKPSKPSK